MCSFEEINDLLFCNMNMHEARKATCKKVQICATVKDCNLWISQGTMCKKEIYNTSLQDFCWFSQNQCRCYLQLNQLCDELSPTAVDGNVLGQISQPNRNESLMYNAWDSLFWVCNSVGQSNGLLNRESQVQILLYPFTVITNFAISWYVILKRWQASLG